MSEECEEEQLTSDIKVFKIIFNNYVQHIRL